MKNSVGKELLAKKLRPYIKGFIAALIALAVMSALSAAIYFAMGAPEGTDGVLGGASLCISCVVFGFFCAGTKGKNGLVCGAVCGIIQFIFTIIVAVITVSFTGEGLFSKMFLCVISSSGGGVLGVNLADRK